MEDVVSGGEGEGGGEPSAITTRREKGAMGRDPSCLLPPRTAPPCCSCACSKAWGGPPAAPPLSRTSLPTPAKAIFLPCPLLQLYMLDGLGIRHGVDMAKLLEASDIITSALGRPTGSRAAAALRACQEGK